ncbi:hypothetical protein I4U23_017887 [Adineta vaga]|nr:hypothetical protein I4U23_017887 [Adineta vaga]
MGNKSNTPTDHSVTSSSPPPPHPPSSPRTTTSTAILNAPNTTVMPTTPTPETTFVSYPTDDTLITTTAATATAIESTSKPTFHSVATTLINKEENSSKPAVKSAAKQWYKWSKSEKLKLEKGKVLWYMNPTVPNTNTDIVPTETITTTVTTPTIKIPESNTKDTSDDTNISVLPSYQLRSTTTHNPPDIDRAPSFQRELTNTDVSNFKYYHPDERSKQSGGIHTKATMYRMNTILKQTPLPTQSSSLIGTNPGDITTTSTKPIEDPSTIRTYVSRGLQTDLEVQPMNSSSSQMRYYEKQQSHIVPLSALSDYTSNNTGLYHLTPQSTNYESTLPPIREPSQDNADQFQSSSVHSNPSVQTSILKKSSTVLSQETTNPLSEQTHDQVVEELRKRNKDFKDGTYRVKKVHLLEKSDLQPPPPPPPLLKVTFNLPPTKASQSITRSEKLFSSS